MSPVHGPLSDIAPLAAFVEGEVDRMTGEFTETRSGFGVWKPRTELEILRDKVDELQRRVDALEAARSSFLIVGDAVMPAYRNLLLKDPRK